MIKISINMIKIKNIGRLMSVILVLAIYSTYPALGQEDKKLTVYDSPEQMVAAAKEVITEIPVEDFRDIIHDNHFIIDVRTAEEYQEGAVPGAVNIPRGVLEFRIGNEQIWDSAGINPPEKDDPIIVYCGTGARGALSAKALMQLGYTNVKSLKGGWGAWQDSKK